VRFANRTPTQLVLLERFHLTLMIEEVYWRLCDNHAHTWQCRVKFGGRDNIQQPHWDLRPAIGARPLTLQDQHPRAAMQ